MSDLTFMQKFMIAFLSIPVGCVCFLFLLVILMLPIIVGFSLAPDMKPWPVGFIVFAGNIIWILSIFAFSIAWTVK